MDRYFLNRHFAYRVFVALAVGVLVWIAAGSGWFEAKVDTRPQEDAVRAWFEREHPKLAVQSVDEVRLELGKPRSTARVRVAPVDAPGAVSEWKIFLERDEEGRWSVTRYEK